jgi:hypothetical protein
MAKRRLAESLITATRRAHERPALARRGQRGALTDRVRERGGNAYRYALPAKKIAASTTRIAVDPASPSEASLIQSTNVSCLSIGPFNGPGARRHKPGQTLES